MSGDQDWEIWVEVDPHELAAFNIPLALINSALKNNLIDQPGGSIKSSEGDIRLRGQGVKPDPEKIAEIVLRTNDNGGELRLGDIARVVRKFEEPKTYARFNGKPSVNLTVTKTADASTIDISSEIRSLSDDLNKELPSNINAGYHTDMSVYVKTRLNVVKSSGLIGLAIGLSTVITGLIFILIVTRSLTQEELGTWGLIGGLITYVVILEPMISYWSTREIARDINSGKTEVISSGVF